MTDMPKPIPASNHRGHVTRPCWETCATPPWETVTETDPHSSVPVTFRTVGNYSRGDVRECDHGHIWFCVGNNLGRGAWFSDGYWVQLDPIFNPVRYRKAKKALAA